MITIEHLSYQFPKQKNEVLKDLNFSIEKGEIFGFLGPSGAGKSTTQKIIIGLLKGYKGSVKILEKEAEVWGSDLYEEIGVAFEFPNFYSKFSAIENLKIFQRLYKNNHTNLMELLNRVQLEEFAQMKVSEYSKGMKMRLNFCRAIMHHPKILFLDEPTSGLDPISTEVMKKLILDLKKEGMTIFLNTHQMSIAEELCDRVAILVGGKIKAIGSPKELKLLKSNKMVEIQYLGDDKHYYSKKFKLDGLYQNDSFQKILRMKKVVTIHTLEPSLEELFIQVAKEE